MDKTPLTKEQKQMIIAMLGPHAHILFEEEDVLDVLCDRAEAVPYIQAVEQSHTED